MTKQESISVLVANANAPLADAGVTRKLGEGPPKFELYHFALSLCSQKVRACLAEKRGSYIAHDINVSLPLFGNYDPAYVRLRMVGQNERSFATGYTGRSSVDTEGFDPAVVPTLVDLEKDLVVTDSARICRHLDNAIEPKGSLIPASLAADVVREIAIVDTTPHVALLYGAHPEIDFRPERLRKSMPGVHDRKIEKIKQARELVRDDAALRAAFDAKIEKEQAGKAFVHDAVRMRRSVEETLQIVADLDGRLSDGRPYVCGDRFTLADIVWSVSLFRLKWLGMAFSWSGNHEIWQAKRNHVHAYTRRLFDRPAFRAAVIDWPGVPRTEYVSEHYSD